MYSKGNPISIGNSITLDWVNGRQLKRYQDSSKNLDINYKYNENGIRISKTVNGTETKYYLENNNIIYQQTGIDVIYFMHDSSGVAGFEYNNQTYYYVKNLQGDITGILDEGYTQLVTYEYDAWGNIVSTKDSSGNEVSPTLTNHIANINPFRYRSYYYDSETGLYYLNARYYNPEFGRFINTDEILGANQDALGYNLYAYCSNNPVNNSDPSGNITLKSLWNKFKKSWKEVWQSQNKQYKEQFVIEGGFGTGASLSWKAGIVKVGAGGYEDITLGYKNGKTYTNISGQKEIVLGVGFGQEYSHEFPFKDRDHELFSSTIQGVRACEEARPAPYISVPLVDKIDFGATATKKSTFIGIDTDLHIGVGVHFKIGFEVPY